tara:strand:- start:3039 stop:6815 length:3777 start_codon:yes stop_codon:yes gene_type:complete
MKKIVFTTLAFFMTLLTFSQNVHEWYQDGVLIFQLNTSSKYNIHAVKHEVNLDEVAFLQDMRDVYGVTEVSRILYDHPDPKLNHTFQINFEKADLVDAFIQDIAKYSFIAYAEKKELHVKFLTPNDLGANSTNGTGMWHLYKMQAQQAWDLSTGLSSVVVAVTDDAINTTHPDLTGKFVAGNDASDQNSTDPNPCGGNDGNHGTHVAGTVGANTNNGTGVSSIGFDVSIMPVKIGRCSDGSLTAGYEGLAWAANNGADVINMSWGGGGSSNFGQNTVDAAYNQGAILVAAAGNNNSTNQFYPAAYNNVVSVASTTTDDSRSSFSQYGTWIDISAPGSAIRSTVANNGYDRYQGTSMASPNVSGLLGLMKSYAPNASRTDLVNCLYSSADPVTSNQGQMGAGRINAFAALQCVSAFTLQTDAGITSISSPENTICGSSFTPELTLRNYGSNTITNLTINYTWGTVNNNFNWSGSLASGQSALVSLPVQSSAGSGSFTFTATANLAGDQLASNDSQSKAFALDPNGQVASLSITTDCYGSETTWEILDDQNNTVVSGGPYTDITGGETITGSYCLPIGCYTFNIYDSYGDGMYGSQWTCNVDGDYFMTDENGANLFQMTAANGDFGNSTSHDFCIINPNINDDAGISEIIFPQSIICSGTFAPQVRIRNFGNNTLNSATISYNVGGPNQSFNWNGNLTLGQTEIVTLPNISANAGIITLTANTTNPNGSADQNTSNDQSQANFTVLSNSLSLPFTESFSSNSISSGTWSVSNPDNAETWEMVNVLGTSPGSIGAKMDFFNYAQSSQRDGLISPKLNFNGYTSINMTFEHAYRRFDQTTTDSLIIYVSSDCGGSWQRIFGTGENSTGSFATATTNENDFIPANSSEWCMGTIGSDCFSLDLTAFSGNEVLVKFEGFNSGTIGNNMYLDNINITGVGSPLVADFNATSTSICVGESISYSDNSTGVVNSQSWSFQGGSPGTSSAASPTVTYNNPGVYDVSYTVNGSSGSNTETKTSYIVVSALPQENATVINTTCNEVSNGSIDLNISAGSGNYNVQWSNGSSAELITGLAVGNYTVTITDATSSCSSNASFTIGSNYSLNSNLTVIDNSATQGNSSITAVASGGTAPYTYSWNSGALSGDFIDNLSGGQYLLTISDGAGCLAFDTASIGLVGLNDLDLISVVNLYPNPSNANTNLFLALSESTNLGLSIFDAIGQSVWTAQYENFNEGLISLPTSNLSEGTYFVKISTARKHSILPLILID